jgi:hypothetical protein
MSASTIRFDHIIISIGQAEIGKVIVYCDAVLYLIAVFTSVLQPLRKSIPLT